MKELLGAIMKGAIMNEFDAEESEIVAIYEKEHGDEIGYSDFCIYPTYKGEGFIVEIGKEKYKVTIERIV